MSAPARPVLSNSAARRLFLDRHGLVGAPRGPATGAALSEVLTDLGFVQVDSVNTVARAHDMILRSRRARYRPESLRWFNDRARATFEHWTHDASIVPMDFYPHWQLRFARDRPRLHARWAQWHGDTFHSELDRVLDHVGRNGPVGSGDLAAAEAERNTGWWDWHPSKTALEYLWRCGDLAITRREGFRKIYDLTERVIPEDLRGQRPDAAETIDWACGAALDRLSFATPGELAAFWALVTPEEAKGWAARALRDGTAIEVDVTSWDGRLRRGLMRPADLDLAEAEEAVPQCLRILSPFDPALRDRARAERLFGFHYRIEIFVPAARRRYGYYVFPVLEGERVIGRTDISAAGDRDCLNVRAFWPESGVKMGKGRLARLEREIEALAAFAGCASITFAEDWLRAPAQD